MPSRKKIYREGLFEGPNLSSASAIEDALYEFESVTHKNNCAAVINDLLSEEQHFVLPLVLSNVSAHVYVPLQTYLSGSFTMNAGEFTDSVAYQVLLKVSEFLLLEHSFSDRGFLKTLSAMYQTVQAAPDMLKNMSTTDFPNTSPFEEDPSQDIIRKKSKQQKRRSTRSNSLNPEPFKKLGYDVPKSRLEAAKLTDQLMEQVKGISGVYLDILRTESVAASIKESCVFTPEVEEIKEPIRESQNYDEMGQETEVPSAYPKVQPIKSALHFDSVEGFGEWTIIISQDAESELRVRHKRERKTFDIIVKKIRELSNGHFSADNQKRLNGSGSEVAIFEAKMTGDLRLIYQVDVVSTGDEMEQQAIKIFGIYTHAQIDNRKWQSIGNRLGRRGKEYRDRCAKRVHVENADDQTFIPASFPPLPEITEDTGLSDLLSDDNDPVYSRLLMDKYVVFSQPLLNSMLADLEATFPHVVSSREKLIIEHPYSSYVIGRSGTGKTTTLLFKMLLVERSYQLAGSDGPGPRQIFVTQSRLLAKKVEQYYATLSRSLAATSQSLDVLRSLCASRGPSAYGEEDWQLDADDDVRWNIHLPKKFSELEDRHFPLFTTFDGLCKMIEADIASLNRSTSLDSVVRELDWSRRDNIIINYDVFLHHYWKHFAQSLTNRLDPALVFSELIGVIKGSEETLDNRTHCLTLTDYQNLSTRKQATFSEIRSDIYAIFNAYIAKRRKLGGQDGADRTHAILDFFKSHGIPGHKIDRLYVDEVQDNLLIDTMILRSLCRDPDGLFWAGDTAQTISVGSSFRFNALRAFQWQLEHQRRQSLVGSHLNVLQPKIFELAVNYRSHAGIVNCAHSVIELLSRFWPNSIDKLSPEKGVTDGPKPIFFAGWDEDAVGLEQFIFGDSHNRIEFGAHQCMLVRDEAAKQKLREKVGEVGLILTIYESKGLEFNDVLLYNFFEDSTSQPYQWQVLLNALEDPSIYAPNFERNKLRYASICVELKFLYVAITRARENLWIVDSSEQSAYLRMYWIKKDLVRILAPGMDIPKLATTSTLEEWATQGRQLFEHKKYAQAKHCFENALLPERVAIADAYLLREDAEHFGIDSERSRRNRKRAFCAAAKAFKKCSITASEKRRLDFLRLVGNCYEKADELIPAAQAYDAAQMPEQAALCYRDADRFDEAVKIIFENRACIKEVVIEDIKRRAKIFYSNRIQSLPPENVERTRNIRRLNSLFNSDDDLYDYLEERDFDIALAASYEANGRIREAAERHLVEGRTLEATALLLKDKNEDSSRRAADYILKGLWRKLTFGVVPSASDSDLSELFDLASKVDLSLMMENERREIHMFQAIKAGALSELRELGRLFRSNNNRPAALLCLDHYFESPLDFPNFSILELVEELKLFHMYTGELCEILSHSSPSTSNNISKLFGFRYHSETRIVLSLGTYLHKEFQTRKGLDVTDQVTLSDSAFRNFFRDSVGDRLKNRISTEKDNCWRCPAFTPCLTYAVFGECRRSECLQIHIMGSSMDKSFYNARVRAHLLQICILGILFMFRLDQEDISRLRRSWLLRLYNAIHPPNHIMGTSACLDLEEIPEVDRARRVVTGWVQGHVFTQTFRPLLPFLSDLLRVTALALIFDKDNALKYLHQGQYARVSSPRIFIRTQRGGLVTHELVSALESHIDSCFIFGALSIRHVVKERLCIDLGVLCDMLDHLCKNVVLANALARNASLHNITAPCSWLMKSAIGLEEQRRKRVPFWYLYQLMDSIPELLEQVYTGVLADHLLLEHNRNYAMKIPNRIRSIFIARICRALCLLGYNIPNYKLQDRILQITTSLRFVGDQFSSLYSRYVFADTWCDIAKAVRGSTRNSNMDKMVQLLHRGALSQTPRAFSNVYQVVYDNLTDIPSLLGGIAGAPISIGLDSASITSPNTNNFNPSVPPTEMTHTEEGDEVETEAEEIEDDPDDASSNISEPLNVNPEIVELTEEEQRAAIRILTAYKQYRARRSMSKSQLIDMRENLFAACWGEGQQVGEGRYRKMMLGPLPHILVALELLYMCAMELKHNTKKHMHQLLQGKELDIVDQQLTRTTAAVKKIKDLQVKLGPRSKIHHQGNIHQLKRLIEDMEVFVRSSLPIQVSSVVMAEFEIGFKGIVKEAKKPFKPELNVEDI